MFNVVTNFILFHKKASDAVINLIDHTKWQKYINSNMTCSALKKYIILVYNVFSSGTDVRDYKSFTK